MDYCRANGIGLARRITGRGLAELARTEVTERFEVGDHYLYVGAVLGLGYQIVAAPPLAGAEGAMNDVMPFVIILIAMGLFLYARAMKAKGVLA